MNQTWENVKKPNFELDFSPFDPNLRPKIISRRLYLREVLDTLSSYHYMQFQGKLMNQTLGNDKKPILGTDLGPFDPDSGRDFFFFKILAQSAARYHDQLSSSIIL